jgi:XTP/dITP diphosphohydrolase
MREILIATKNQGKLKEIRELFRGLDLKVTSLSDYSGCPEIIEDGKTFQENAVKKAMVIARHTQKLVVGEDSGLEVRALDNRPGIFSSRFSGPGATDKKNNAKLLRLLSSVPFSKREARYRCCVALADGDNLITVVEGSCRGRIAQRPQGPNGFGYDPLFYLLRYRKTFGELDPQIKARISHRARAFRKLKLLLRQYLSSHSAALC